MAFTVASGSVTRPADTTAYASGDLVANSTTAGSVTPISFTDSVGGGDGVIRRVRLHKTDAGVTNAAFRLHLYTGRTFTVTNGDNGAWASSGMASYLGFVDVTVDKVFTDGSVGVATTTVPITVAGGTVLKGQLEARGSYTPASAEVFTVYLEIER